ncbi:MAG: hypothetical protein ACK4OM_07315 [Alphaproteobacteria bacterium]
MKNNDLNQIPAILSMFKDILKSFLSMSSYRTRYNRLTYIMSSVLKIYTAYRGKDKNLNFEEQIENLNQKVIDGNETLNQGLRLLKNEVVALNIQYKEGTIRERYIDFLRLKMADKSITDENYIECKEIIKTLSGLTLEQGNKKALNLLIQSKIHEFEIKFPYKIENIENFKTAFQNISKADSYNISDKFKLFKKASDKVKEFKTYMNSKSWVKKARSILDNIYTIITSEIFTNIVWVTSAVIGFVLATAATGGLILPTISLVGTLAVICCSIAANVNSMRSYRNLVEENEYLTAIKELKKSNDYILKSFNNEELNALNIKENSYKSKAVSPSTKPSLLYAFAKVSRDKLPSYLNLVFGLLSMTSIYNIVVIAGNAILGHGISVINRKERDERKYLIKKEIYEKKLSEEIPEYKNLKDLKKQYSILKERNKALKELLQLDKDKQVSNVVEIAKTLITKDPSVKSPTPFYKKFSNKLKVAAGATKRVFQDIISVLNPFYKESKLIDKVKKEIYGDSAEKELNTYSFNTPNIEKIKDKNRPIKKFKNEEKIVEKPSNEDSLTIQTLVTSLRDISTIFTLEGTLGYVLLPQQLPTITPTIIGLSLIPMAISHFAYNFRKYLNETKTLHSNSVKSGLKEVDNQITLDSPILDHPLQNELEAIDNPIPNVEDKKILNRKELDTIKELLNDKFSSEELQEIEKFVTNIDLSTLDVSSIPSDSKTPEGKAISKSKRV